MGNKRNFTRADLIDWMQRIKEQQCGKSSIFGPTKKQIRLAKFSRWERKPLLKDFIDEFNGYEEAIKAAGYEIPPEEILSSIKVTPPPDPAQTPDLNQEKEKDMPRPQPRSKEELLADFRDVTAELGHPPNSAEWEKLRKSGRKIASAPVYFSKFGRWAELPKIAGVEESEPPADEPAADGSITTEPELAITNKPVAIEPTTEPVPEVSETENAPSEEQNSASQGSKRTDEQCLEDLFAVAVELGHSPTRRGYDAHRPTGALRAKALVARFGSWNNALERANLEPTDGAKRAQAKEAEKAQAVIDETPSPDLGGCRLINLLGRDCKIGGATIAAPNECEFAVLKQVSFTGIGGAVFGETFELKLSVAAKHDPVQILDFPHEQPGLLYLIEDELYEKLPSDQRRADLIPAKQTREEVSNISVTIV